MKGVTALGCLLVCALSPILIAGDEVVDLYPSASASLSELEPGTRVRITGKYTELVGEEIRLAETRMAFLARDPDLLKRVLRFKSRRDNLTLLGRVVEVEGGRAIELDAVYLAANDVEVFRQELEKILAGKEEEAGLALLDLTRRVDEHHEKFQDPEVKSLAREIAARALRSEDSRLPPEDIDTRLERVRDVYRLLKDRQVAMDYLIEIDKRSPDHQEVRSCLLALNCRKYKGQWVTFEEFKRQEGFTFHKGKWVSPHEKDLIESIREFKKQEQMNLILRPRTEREYKLLASRGVVELGMKPQEVHQAIGFPDRVERRVADQKEVDQWIYRDEYYYFYGGLLVKKPKKAEEEAKR